MTSTSTLARNPTTPTRGPTTPTRGSTKRQLRILQRGIHLFTGLMVMAYVYGGPMPGGFVTALQWVAMPALVLSGLVMWPWPRIRSLLRRRRQRA